MAAQVQTLTVQGEGPLQPWLIAGGLTHLDASGHNGTLKFQAPASSAGMTIRSGSGDNYIGWASQSTALIMSAERGAA